MLYSLLNPFPFIFPLVMSFSKLSVLSSVIYLPSTLVFNPSLLALVIIFNISLNFSLLTLTHFGSFNSSDCLSGKIYTKKKIDNPVNNTQYQIKSYQIHSYYLYYFFNLCLIQFFVV